MYSNKYVYKANYWRVYTTSLVNIKINTFMWYWHWRDVTIVHTWHIHN